MRLPWRRERTEVPLEEIVPVAEPAVRTRDQFGLRDILAEAGSSIGGRPGRLVLTVLGTVLGIASVVVTVGLAQTASGQIAKRFDAVGATQAVLEPSTQSMGGRTRVATSLPWDAEERLERVAGVEAAGLVSEVDVLGDAITAVPVTDPSAPALTSPSVLAGSPGLLAAVRGHVAEGRWFDEGHSERADRVVVLGSRAADRLGVHRVATQPSIFIGSRAYAVIGIVDDVARRTDLLDAVVMPLGTAVADYDLRSADQVQVRIALGAGEVLKEQGPVVLEPNTPENIRVQVPVIGSGVQDSVQSDISTIFLALGAVALLVGGLGIANVTLLSVFERVGEIGLRRALGATRANIAAQFLVESVVIGLLGGLIGSALGVAAIVGVSVAQEWTPILDVRVTLGAAALGGVIGLLAGLYPSLKAAGVEPIAALRGGV
ncbi:MAG: ABC transporter permease [Cellulomonadaceae bacterium]